MKKIKNGEFWGYSEATHVTLNSDGSLSFNEFYDNKVKHDNGTTSHFYTQYRAWINGHTLQVKPLSVGFWYDRNGNLKSHTETEERPNAIWPRRKTELLISSKMLLRRAEEVSRLRGILWVTMARVPADS